MEPTILFGEINNSSFYKRNQINRVKHNLVYIPFLSVKNYFFWNYENIYFLILSIFQLLTLGPIPKEWSPTGPFSTALPLLFCVILEIIKDCYKWYKDWKLDYETNNREIKSLNLSNKNYFKNPKFDNILNKNLRVGNIIKLKKNDVVPADGLLLDCYKDKYAKISLAPLNGECNIQYINKIGFKDLDLTNSLLTIYNYYPNNFYNFDGTLTINNDNINIDGNSFIVSDSIVKSNNILLWVIRCGEQKKSYIKDQKTTIRSSRLDSHVASYMMNINTYLLITLIFIVSLVKSINYEINQEVNFLPFRFFFFSIQNWILFNGIIPFSVKIFLLFVRNVQSNILNKDKNIIINSSQQIDDINKIDMIITDKTGTLTKNELEFSKIIQIGSSKVIDVENYMDNNDEFINLDFIKCLGLCIHQIENEFTTVEDKTIRYRYQFLNSRITQIGSKIKLFIDNNEFDYEYMEIVGLDFTYDRKLSSKIVKSSDDKYFIFSKGSIDIIRKKIRLEHLEELNRIDNIISSQHPDLRLLACAYREIDKNELSDNLFDSFNQKIFVESLENNLSFLGLIGIKDGLQTDVNHTIKELSNLGINCSMCTGDRKITAVAIGYEAGLFSDYDQLLEYEHDNHKDIPDKTLIFSGSTLPQIIRNKQTLENFKDHLKICKNFIGYNLIPDDKRRLTKILEQKGVKTLTIGDGFNDINMFKASSISVAIKGHSYVENSADFCLTEFQNLLTLIKHIGPNYYYKNTLLANFTFYRCIVVVLSLVTYHLINYNRPTISLYDGFVIQAFNFAWCIVPIILYGIKKDYNKYNNKIKYIDSHKGVFSQTRQTTRWNIIGFITSIINTCLTYQYFGYHEKFNDILTLLMIMILNLKLLLYIKDVQLITYFIGPILFLVYTLYKGSFLGIISTLFLSFEGIKFLIMIMIINFTINIF